MNEVVNHVLSSRQSLIDALAEMRDVPQLIEQHRRWIDAFRSRFPIERLARLQGEELLLDLHGRGSGDCLMHWLEFKDDETFRQRAFGSIAGGSALKFGMYQRKEDSQFYLADPNDRAGRKVSWAEAVSRAERQRDELVAATEVVRSLDPSDEATYAELQQRIEQAAPELHRYAFLHKFLFLQRPDALDDFHSRRYQVHLLIALGIRPPDGDEYACAWPLVSAWRAFGKLDDAPFSVFGKLLNSAFGGPVRHWRIGAGADKAGSEWPAMRDGNYVAVGWNEIGDLRALVGPAGGRDARERIKAKLEEAYVGKAATLIGREAVQLRYFLQEMQEGDLAYVADGMRILGVGRITGDCTHVPGTLYANRRPVEWLSLEPFAAPDKTGLRTTVYPLDKAIDLRLAAAQHIAGSVPISASGARAGASNAPPPLSGMLATIASELERKGQVILYGPPGTGKTWHARSSAREIAARASFQKPWNTLSVAEQDALAHGDGQRIWSCTFYPSYGYEDFVEGLRPVATPAGLAFVQKPGIFRRICDHARMHAGPHVLLVDEINRGDVARIFGELLTLLEIDKRGMEMELPSGDRFSVPPNVRVIATMNTADRSIALLDTALRRRFGFVELMPDASLLGSARVGGMLVGDVLARLNGRLLAALGPDARNLQVGHSFFMRDGGVLGDVRQVRRVFQYELLPLLQEYTYDDSAALARILGTGFFDAERGEPYRELFEEGQEEAFLAALRQWDIAATDDDSAVAVDEADEEPDEDAA